MSKKVIIIDDSLTSLNIIKTAFASCDWEVYGMQNARSAIDLIYNVAPDLIVTDAIMPVIGGFQLLKIIKNDPKISKIPTIVYSVLDEYNSKFYIKEDRAEYYMQKSDDLTKLTEFASKIIKKHPLTLDYKYEILKANIENDSQTNTSAQNDISKENEVLNIENLESQFKEKYDFSKSDDKVLFDIFSILYKILKYNLSIICINSSKNEKTAYFDIRDIILSPIFQNHALQRLNAKSSHLFKKYAPNLKVITNEGEFLTKVRFDFEYNDKIIANAIFYSKEKSKWLNDTNLDEIKNMLDNFFRARHLNKSVNASRNNDISSKYFIDKLDFKIDLQNKKQMYVAILEIINFKDLQDNLSSDEIDFLNSKISETLISFMGENEQVYKNEEGEYTIVLFSKDKNSVIQKLNWIVDLFSEPNFNKNKIEVIIGACNCKIDNQFNFYEAQKCARKALEDINSKNKVIIYDAK